MPSTKEKGLNPDSIDKMLKSVISFMQRCEKQLVSNVESLKSLQETNDYLEETLLDVLLVMSHNDLMHAIFPCECKSTDKKAPGKKKNG